MKATVKNIVPIITLAVSLAAIILGIVFINVSCNGRCGATNHGGMLTWICPEFYTPPALSIVLIATGVVGTLASISFLVFREKSKPH